MALDTVAPTRRKEGLDVALFVVSVASIVCILFAPPVAPVISLAVLVGALVRRYGQRVRSKWLIATIVVSSATLAVILVTTFSLIYAGSSGDSGPTTSFGVISSS